MYSYREFLELQKKSREHQDKKMQKMYAKAQTNQNVETKEEADETEYPFGIRVIKQ